MECIPINQTHVIPFYLVALLFYGYRWWQNPTLLTRPITTRFMAGAVLMLLVTISETSLPLPLWRHLSGLFLYHQGLLLTLLGVHQLLDGRPARLFSRNPWVLAMIVLSLISVGIDGMHIHQRAVILGDMAPLAPTAYLAYSLNYALQTLILGTIVVLYARNLRKHADIVYRVRRTICIVGYTVSIGCILLTRMRYLLMLEDSPQVWSNASCRINFSLSIVLLMIGFMLPHAVLERATRPLARMLGRRRQRTTQLLEDLHSVILTIVPGIRLNNRSIRHLRTVIEINDARQIIWSQTEHRARITPLDDARRIAQLLQDRVVLLGPGDYHAPPLKQPCSIRHNIAMAKHLKRILGSVQVQANPEFGTYWPGLEDAEAG